MRFLWMCLLTMTFATRASWAEEPDSTSPPKFDAAAIEFFEKEVRPLLASRCYECHSANAEKLEGGLRLDSRDAAIEGGDTGPAIVPHKPDESLLIDAIDYGEVYQMPPKSKLPANEIAVLTKWVSLGAPWPKEEVTAADALKVFDLNARRAAHWCWQPIRDPTPPAVRHREWARQPLDNFILAKLEEAGLTPAAPADKRTLIRRAYFDLIGLPPSPEEVAAFLHDESPRAFEKVVDQLLDSPHFGERWARHWMDLMRYAETYGHEFDYAIPHAYKYRDYLIRALNADVPYDRFVMEHVAGDLLQPPRLHPTEGYNESAIATGFWWLGEATHAPVDVLGDEAGRIDNQIDVFSKTFLGLTIACARCHDHKFDAISTKDYYAMAGFLQSSRRHEALLDRHGEIAAAAAQLTALKREADAVILQAYTSEEVSGDSFARYLLAAREVLFGEPKTAASSPPQLEEIVFEDFESETYEGWTTEGTAFGSGPQSQATTPGYQGDIGAVGKRWVNSHNMRDKDDVARGDNHVGTLTSEAFRVERGFINFLVGGGNHKEKTCVNLLVDGKVVRSQTGLNQNKMRPAQFDVADLVGKQATIQVVDQEKGGWGNIGIDHIVFSNGDLSHRRPINEVAAEFKIDADRLSRWVAALSGDEVKDRSHPLYAWHRLAAAVGEKEYAALRSTLDQEAESAKSFAQRYPLLSGFDNFDGWFVTGNAFGDGPTASGEWDARQPNTAQLQPAVANSGRISNRLQGTLRSPTFTLQHPNIYYRIKGEGVTIRLVLDGYFMDTNSALLFRGFTFDVKSPDKFTWYHQAQDVGRYLGHRGYIEILDHGNGSVEIDEIRFSNEGPPPEPINSLAAEVLSSDANSIDQLASAFGSAWQNARSVAMRTHGDDSAASDDHIALWNWVAKNDLLPVNAHVVEQITATYHAMQKIDPPSGERVLSLGEGTAENLRIYVRGNHRTLGREAPRRMLTALVREPFEIESGSGRLQLAQQIVDPANPMTARVMVNRMWHHLTGRGIVASTDNFGVLGQAPTHPELLDHLASEFVREGWSIKRLLKQMTLSSTYQMASTPDETGDARDPQNLLLHRARIRRLQGEAIRDSILAISGHLDRTTRGPSVAVHITPFMEGRGRPQSSGPLDGNGRRSLYIEVRRNFLSPMMLAFDSPIPFNAVGRRNTSNVPAQALIMMNDPFVVEQAKLWAKRTIEQEPTIESRINAMYLAAFARPPSEQEIAAGTEFLRQQSESLGLTDVQAVDDERVWADFCHVLLNVKEFVFLK
ncbi:MAG: PSD1 and planctomycete cytochrome C domain-containing protein [Planctomycetota bacterium]|nr:PSD1 and planctomycete cytochrome C domain-containing protein [Planctomycetota bacterium]